MIGRMVAGLVHDLSHPIQNLGNSTRLLVRDDVDAESRQSQNNPLELCVELAPPTPRRLPVSYARGLWSDHGRH